MHGQTHIKKTRIVSDFIFVEKTEDGTFTEPLEFANFISIPMLKALGKMAEPTGLHNLDNFLVYHFISVKRRSNDQTL